MPTFCKKKVNDETGLIEFDFQDEGTPIVFDINKMPDNIVANLALHGASQKIGDSYAGAAGDYDAARKAAQSVIDQLIAGDWKAARAAGEPRTTLLVEALSRATGQSMDASAEVIGNMEKEQRVALGRHPEMKEAKAVIQLERAKAAKEKGGAPALSELMA